MTIQLADDLFSFYGGTSFQFLPVDGVLCLAGRSQGGATGLKHRKFLLQLKGRSFPAMRIK